MNANRAKYESLLADWRNAQTKVDALRAFADKGGAHRLRIETDGDHPVIIRIMDDLMQEGGYSAFLASAIKRAEHHAAKAQRAFLDAAVSDSGGIDAAGGGSR